MSRLRDKVAAHRRQGEERRGTYVPAVDGAPLRVYQWWHAKTESTIERDNFCHYWRVVIFWAPLLGIRLVMARLLGFRAVQLTVLLFGLVVAYVFCRELGAEGRAGLAIGTVMIIGIPYVAIGIGVGFVYHTSSDTSYAEFLDGEPTFLRRLACAVIPVAFVVDGIATAVVSKPVRRVGKKALQAFCALLGLAIAMVVGKIFYAMYVESWWYPLLVIGILVGILVLVTRSPSEASKLRRFARAQRRRDIALSRRIVSHSTRPRRIRAFMRAVLEFAQLAFEALRVEKWKICPLVEISPTDRVTS